MDKPTTSTIGKACDACRLRKLKCSNTAPRPSGVGTEDARCSRCIKSGLRCTYNDEHGKRGPKTGKRLNALRASQNAEQPRLNAATVQVEGSNSSPSSDSSLQIQSNFESDVSTLYEPIPVMDSMFPGSDVFHRHEDMMPALNDQDRSPVFMHEIQAWSPLTDNFLFSNEDLHEQMNLFFRHAYAAYPVIHYDTVIKKINENRHLTDPDFKTLVLSLVILNEACKFRQSPEHGTATMDILAKTIETSRAASHDYHFSENPSLDTVIVSLILFVFYNVTNKHNRAFCYLTEAIGLFDLVEEPDDLTEAIRLQRLEYVLFNTESASISIYGPLRKRLISRRPLNLPAAADRLVWYKRDTIIDRDTNMYPQFDLSLLDKRAVELLLRMTRLHLATTATEVASVTLDDLLLDAVTEGFNGVKKNVNLTYDTQAADVAITRQWKLAEFWWISTSNRVVPSSSQTALKGTIEMIATTALTWSKTIQPNNMRIIGLGKMASLTDSVLRISSELGFKRSCSNLIADLIHTVAETDYERLFAPQLSMTELYIGNVPRTILSQEDMAQLFDNDQVG